MEARAGRGLSVDKISNLGMSIVILEHCSKVLAVKVEALDKLNGLLEVQVSLERL
jgi:hypothetical protein